MNDMGVRNLPEVTPTVEATPTVSVLGTCRVSVLMGVLGRDTNITYVADALESIGAQSILPDQLVLVIDSPLADKLEAVIARHMSLSDIPSMEIVRVPNKHCIAAALNDGIARCNGDWIMCLNGDSVCHQERLAIQLDYTARHPEIDVWLSWCEEFDEGVKRINASAIYHDSIVTALRRRKVLVYSSALIRSSVLHQIGGYRRDTLGEYDLFVRLALAGARFRGIPAELVSMPAPRRAGVRDAWREVCFRVVCWRAGFLSLRLFLVTFIAPLFSLLFGPFSCGLYALVRTRDTVEASCYPPLARTKWSMPSRERPAITGHDFGFLVENEKAHSKERIPDAIFFDRGNPQSG